MITKKCISLNKFQFCTHSQKCYECKELLNTTSTKVISIVVKRETQKHVAKRQNKYKKVCIVKIHRETNRIAWDIKNKRTL